MTKYLLSAVIIPLFATGCAVSNYPIDKQPVVKADPRLEGKWRQLIKDTNAVYIVKKKDDYEYSVTIKGTDWDKMKLNAFLSEVDDALFLNVYDNKDSGYILARILNLNTAANEIMLTMVDDSTMKYLNGSVEVRARIAGNLNNPSYYTDTVKMRKEK